VNLSATFLSNLTLAIGLGLGVAVLLWLLRRFAFAQRIRLSLMGVVIGLGVYWVLQGANYSSDDPAVKIVIVLIALLATNAVLQLIDAMLWRYLLGRQRNIVIPRLLVDLFNAIALIAVALVLLNRVFDVDLNAVLVTSTVASAVIGLAVQDTLGNVISGLALQLDRPFQVGNWIRVNDQEGEIIQMNWRTVTLQSIDHHLIVIANSNMARNDIVNYSRPSTQQRLRVSIGLSYTDPPGEVRRVLLRAVGQAEGVCAEPPPEVLIREYGESAIAYDAHYWVDDYARHQHVRDAVLTRIWYALQREGMSIPFPIRDVNVRQIPEDYALQTQEHRRQQVFIQLRPLAVFAPLSDEQIELLARKASSHRYTAGEYLVRQGEVGDSLFVIKSGRARVDVQGTNGHVTTVASRGPNDFFGEMSLLTGERRSASVIAETETEVIIVGKESIAEVLSEDLDRLEALSKAVEARLQESAAKIAASAGKQDDHSALPTTHLLTRIQNFLGINR